MRDGSDEKKGILREFSEFFCILNNNRFHSSFTFTLLSLTGEMTAGLWNLLFLEAVMSTASTRFGEMFAESPLIVHLMW